MGYEEDHFERDWSVDNESEHYNKRTYMYVPCTVPMNSARTKPNLAQSYAIRNDFSAKIMIYEGAGNNSLSHHERGLVLESLIGIFLRSYP